MKSSLILSESLEYALRIEQSNLQFIDRAQNTVCLYGVLQSIFGNWILNICWLQDIIILHFYVMKSHKNLQPLAYYWMEE